MVLYNGSLQEFATEMLCKGRGNGTMCMVCTIAEEIVTDMEIMGEGLFCRNVFVTQRQIFKYRNHPKSTKGANLPLSEYSLIEKALKNPACIYEDTVQNRLVYVYTYPYHEKYFVKVVVEPNYKMKGLILNIAKSWGVVEGTKMGGRQYRRIK
jgi:hypothetical protein